jgi:acyl carrier protein
MGLDLVDMMIQIEEELNIEISSDDWSSIAQDGDTQVGALYELILHKLNLRDFGRKDIRLNLQLWTEMQNVLHLVTEVNLDQIELSTPLETLFPKDRRRELWTTLRTFCPYRVAELDYPKAVRNVGLLLALVVVAMESFHLWGLRGLQFLWPLLGMIVPILGLIAIWMVSETYLKILKILASFRNQFPKGMKTVKDLCRAVLASNFAELCQGMEIPFDQPCLDIWQKLVQILADTSGVDAERITFSSRLVRDLGMA